MRGTKLCDNDSMPHRRIDLGNVWSWFGALPYLVWVSFAERLNRPFGG